MKHGDQIGALVEHGIEMLCRSGYRDVGHAAYTLIEDVFQRVPAAVKCQPAEIVDMDVAVGSEEYSLHYQIQ